MKYANTICTWPAEERFRERLAKYGEHGEHLRLRSEANVSVRRSRPGEFVRPLNNVCGRPGHKKEKL